MQAARDVQVAPSHFPKNILKGCNYFYWKIWSEPATTDGRVAAPPYVPVQAAEVGSVIQAARGVQVVLSHFPEYHLSNL